MQRNVVTLIRLLDIRLRTSTRATPTLGTYRHSFSSLVGSLQALKDNGSTQPPTLGNDEPADDAEDSDSTKDDAGLYIDAKVSVRYI